MIVGLIDVDGGSYPNLALMKASAYHKRLKDTVYSDTVFRHYDIVYKSKIFTFTEETKNNFTADRILKGGTGYSIKQKLPVAIEKCCPDYALYNCEHAYGFLTRGCIRKCPWCLVPAKEGAIAAYADIDDFIGDKKSAVLMDNNVLASDHGIRQIEKIIEKKIKIDFNQGLDARLIDSTMAKLLSKVKWLSPLRLACDSSGMMEPVRKEIELLRWNNCTPRRYFVYTLIQDIPEAIERIRFLKGIDVDPFAQPYRDTINNIEPTQEQKHFARWINQKAIYKSVTWDEYKSGSKKGEQQQAR